MFSLKAKAAAVALVALPGSAAAGSVVFTDNAFNPADYSDTSAYTQSGETISAGQCSACGDPGDALQISIVVPIGGGYASQGYLNNTFAYDPGTQGAITKLSVSVDKDATFNFSPAPGSYTSSIQPTIQQGGNEYLATIPVKITITGNTTGWTLASGSGLTAADFDLYDFSTGMTDSTSHPNFASGPMTFGLTQISFTGGNGFVETQDIDYDNLRIALNSVPEPSTWAMMLIGVGALGSVLRRRRERLPV